jgi:hypothetical protein
MAGHGDCWGKGSLSEEEGGVKADCTMRKEEVPGAALDTRSLDMYLGICV